MQLALDMWVVYGLTAAAVALSLWLARTSDWREEVRKEAEKNLERWRAQHP